MTPIDKVLRSVSVQESYALARSFILFDAVKWNSHSRFASIF